MNKGRPAPENFSESLIVGRLLLAGSLGVAQSGFVVPSSVLLAIVEIRIPYLNFSFKSG